jgi:hypothetical protein
MHSLLHIADAPHVSDDSLAADDAAVSQPTVRRVLVWAVATGVAADALLRSSAVGVNVSVVLVMCIAGLTAVDRRRLGTVPREAVPLLATATLFALLVSVRESSIITLWNIVTAISALMLAAATMRPSSVFELARTRVRDILRHMGQLLRSTAVAAVPFFVRDAGHAFDGVQRRIYAARLVVRSLVMATAVALVFTMLLAGGDPVFARVTSVAFTLDFGAVLGHLFFTLLFAWPVLGFLTGSALRYAVATPAEDERLHRLARLDVVTTLGALNGVFALFLLVQLRALFGGMSYVQAVTGLTMAQYARSGFFTLSAVGGLTLVALLVMHAMLRRDSSGIEVSYRRFAIALMAQVSVVMASAIVRMSLYVQEFGLSADRLYTFAGMIWIAIVFAWFSATILSGRPLRFARGALYSAWGMLLALNVLNPEGLVVTVNARRAIAGAEFDVEYPVTMLSADAVPALVNALVRPGFPLDARLNARGSTEAPCLAPGNLLDRWGPPVLGQRSGRTRAEARARRAIRTHEVDIRARSCTASAPVAAIGGLTTH